MQSKRRLILFVTAFAVVFGFLAIAAPLFAASKEKVLYSFCTIYACKDGGDPTADLIFDAAGNLYGTTDSGGASGAGTVFELSPGADGTWTETVLYSFCPGGWPCADGQQPQGGLIFDATGNLYGTTSGGGNFCFGITSCGVVFRLTPGTNGTWTETVLYSFCSASGCTDGASPNASLVLDAAGNLYGTTEMGGSYGSGCKGYGCGTVFELKPGANGTWTETVLHSFGNGKDGTYPFAGLIFDAAGNLYSTTVMGGPYGWGTVFELTPNANGKWSEKVLHAFSYGKGGESPWAGLIFDTYGNLYGTTEAGGAHNVGTAFELTPGAGGKWKEKVLHTFNGEDRKDGSNPVAGLIFDTAGNVYGTTTWGGPYGWGTVFELTPNANGRWTEKVLHFFNGDGRKDGGNPYAGLILDAAGNLYGTTTVGGANVNGTVFEITP
jgi:uncharacterized repeat protein (TIGR03803 family)